jgi:hypothetical protein
VPIRQTPAEGKVLVRLLRNGLEIEGGFQTVTGDVVAVPPARAEQIVRNGAGEFETKQEGGGP